SSDPAIASVSGNTVTIHASGIVTITASQGGNAAYLPAADVQRTLAISKAGITGITFDDGEFTYDGTPKSIFITGVPPAGTDLSYSGNGQTNAGTYTIIANIDGGNNYNDLSLEAVMIINKAPQTITFVPPGTLSREIGRAHV